MSAAAECETGQVRRSGRASCAATVMVTVLAAVAGCAGGSSPRAHDKHRSNPAAEKTVVRNGRVVPAGTAVPFLAQAGVALRLAAAKPSISRERLSSSYGYAPAHGYYVTFRVVIANTGRKPVQVTPANFFVRIGAKGRVTSYDGNAPYSGASAQLDPTVVEPGDRVRAPLTFDVGARHGRLAYAPDGSPAVIWRF
jgi:hypothetical protein